MCEWLINPKHGDFRPLFTTQGYWTFVKYVMNELRPFLHWTLWMSTMHQVTLHHGFTVYNDMFDHMESILPALPVKNTQWLEDL
jgi:hypothetical protein